MPVQQFAPMTKDFPTFDCDAHVTEPPWIWERVKDWLTKDELEALKTTMWFDAETKQLIVNGHVGAGLGSQRIGGTSGVVNVLTSAGPGLKHNIQRALNVRNLNPKTAITKEQADYIDHKGSYEPTARLRDMDVQGIDQVMIIPTDIDTYPWLQNAVGRMSPTRHRYTEQYSGAELIARTVYASGLPHFFLTNVQNFQAEAALWVTMVLLSGFFDRHPKLRAAVFEASSTWLSFLVDECDKYYKLYRNERQLPPLKRLPSETFFEHCVTGFEGDEAPPSRLPEFYQNILAWSSDVYHHDGDDAWRAIETMRKCELPEPYQAKFLGENARKLYHITPPKKFIRERVTEIERPEWWPTEGKALRRGHERAPSRAWPFTRAPSP